jgi:hypothetical protein
MKMNEALEKGQQIKRKCWPEKEYIEWGIDGYPLPKADTEADDWEIIEYKVIET